MMMKKIADLPMYDNQIDDFLNYRKTKSVGLSTGFTKLDKIVNKIQQGTYYLIGGKSGSGKTTFADYSFLLNAIIDARKLGKRIKIFYYSFEISYYRKFAKLLAYSLFRNYGYELSDLDVLNKTDLEITPELDKLIEKHYHQLVEFLKDVVFTWEATNPTQVYKDLMNHAHENGKFIKKDIIGKNGDVVKTEQTYIPNDPDLFTIIIVDHARLTKSERNYNRKEKIDKLSEYLKDFRNICNFTPVLIQQLNRSINAIDRQKLKGEDLMPNDADFADSGDPYQDKLLTSFTIM